MTEDDNSNPPAPNQHLADMLDEKSHARLRRQARRFVSQRSSVQTFTEFNQRRAEMGLPPVWPSAVKAAAPPPPPEQTAMKNGASK